MPPFLKTAVALSSPFIFFFLSFLLHGDSLLYKCKYFFSSAVSGLLVCVFVLHLPLYYCVSLLGDSSAIHLHLQKEIGSSLGMRLDFTRRLSQHSL